MKKTIRRLAIACSTVMSASILAPVCFADGFTGIAEIDSMFTNFLDLLFAALKVGGVAMLIYGIYLFATSFQQHDPSARLNGILLMVGGGFMYFAERVLGFIGITV